MTISKAQFRGVVDRPDFRYVGPVWNVGEYDLVDDSEGKEVVARPRSNRRPYAPLQEPDLFLSFARLASRVGPYEKAVLRWVRKYGLLRKAEERQGDLLTDGEPDQAPVKVEDFVAEALEARGALDLYADLSGGGVGTLEKRIGKLCAEYEIGGQISGLDRYFVKNYGGEAGKAGRFDGGNLQMMATVQLEGFVEAKLEDVRLALWDEEYALGSLADRYRPTQSWKCPDLISAVYLQFYLLMTQSLEMRRCKNPACGMPIPVTRRNRWFCNPTCRSNMRHYR